MNISLKFFMEKAFLNSVWVFMVGDFLWESYNVRSVYGIEYSESDKLVVESPEWCLVLIVIKDPSKYM